MDHKILVVMDSPSLAKLIAEHLSQAGHRVTVRDNLDQALRWLRTAGDYPDLIISDVTMSERDGHKFIRQIRAGPASVYPLVVLLAAQDDIAEKIVGFEAGADDYLVKPIDTIELGLRVRALLARAQDCLPSTITSK